MYIVCAYHDRFTGAVMYIVGAYYDRFTGAIMYIVGAYYDSFNLYQYYRTYNSTGSLGTNIIARIVRQTTNQYNKVTFVLRVN